MKKICISKDWLLSAPGTNGFVQVDLPNDYAVSQPRDPNAAGGGGNGYFTGGMGTYVKYIDIPDDHEHRILDIDGAYMLATVCVNEDIVAMHPYGYTPFLIDLTERLRPGHTNKLKIRTDDHQPSTRWYSGAGLYRDVFMWIGGGVRVEPRDVFVTTVSADDDTAVVRISYLISSDIDGEAVINAVIPETAEGSVSVKVKKGSKTEAEIILTVERPRLWDTEDPHMYTLKTTVTAGEHVTDTDTTQFGIRTITVDAESGFRLNGKEMKLRGGCIHHDHGVLGAAAYPAAEYRKISLLKKAGFNAVRTAHYPPSLALLEACDRLGMLVMDEAFDMWNEMKNPCDYHLWFADWWARDISYMVLRDRNHPSVISYSIGNEVSERNGKSDGAKWARMLADEIRKYDSSRPVTAAACGVWSNPEQTDPEPYKADYAERFGLGEHIGTESEWDRLTKDYFAPLDMAGYNYLFERYEYDHGLFPSRVIWGSETHALRFFDSWRSVLAHPYVIGDFTWTAYDNLGESGTGRGCWARDGHIDGISLAPYPWRSCYQGDLDLCGYRRPQSYFREAVWIGNTEPRIFTTHPEHYGEGYSGTDWHWYDVLDTWTFDDKYVGKPVKCEVYTDADEIEWILNGKSLGIIKPEKGIAAFDIPYEKGELTAVAYKNGTETGRSSLRTVGESARISVMPERTQISADRRDLAYFDITVTDMNGDRVPDAKNELICTVEGGELLGVFSGDPKNEDQYTSPVCHAFCGRALAVVRAGKTGTVALTVCSPGLADGKAEIKAE